MLRGEQRNQRRRRYFSALRYKLLKPELKVEDEEDIDAKILNISGAGACILTESVHEPGMLLNMCHQLQGAKVSVLRSSLLAQVKWISPLWVTHINVYPDQGTMSSETFVKGSFVVGLEFLPDGLPRA